MNFLFDLIHFHSSIPFLGIGYPFHLLTGGEGNELLIMSSLFGLIYSPLTTVNERSFASIVDLESSKLQENNPLLGLTNYNSFQLQIMNPFLDWIHSHSFYLKIIAVSILVFLLILIIIQRNRSITFAQSYIPEHNKTIFSSTIIGNFRIFIIDPPMANSPERPVPPAPPNTPEPQPLPQPGQGQQPQSGPLTSPGSQSACEIVLLEVERALTVLGYFGGITVLRLRKFLLFLQQHAIAVRRKVTNSIYFNLSKNINIDTLYNCIFFCCLFLIFIYIGSITRIPNLFTNFFPSCIGPVELNMTISLSFCFAPALSNSVISQSTMEGVINGKIGEARLQCSPLLYAAKPLIFMLKIKSFLVRCELAVPSLEWQERYMNKSLSIHSVIFSCVERLIGFYNITFSFEGEEKTPFIKMSKYSENINENEYTSNNTLENSNSPSTPTIESSEIKEDKESNPSLPKDQPSNWSLNTEESTKKGEEGGGQAASLGENESSLASEGEENKGENSKSGTGYWSDFDWNGESEESEGEERKERIIKKLEPEQESDYDGDVEDFKLGDFDSDF